MTAHPTDALGGYLLGVLPPGDEPGVRRHLEECEMCRARVNELEGISELLAAARLVPEEAPRLAPHILATLPRTGQAFALGRSDHVAPGLQPDAAGHSRTDRSATTDEPGRDCTGQGRHHLRHRTAVITAAVIVLAAAVAATILHVRGGETSPTVTLSPSGTDAAGSATFDSSVTGTEISLKVRSLPPGTYEVTVDDGVTVLPAGGFTVDAGGTAAVVVHTAATAGELQISASDGDSRTALLRATLPG